MDYDPFDPFSEPPMYTDYTLRFTDADEADGVLFDEQTIVNDDIVEIVKVPKYSAVDVIGVIYKPTGKMLTTDEGEMPETAPVEGWHVNVRHAGEAPELDSHKIEVKTPARMWA